MEKSSKKLLMSSCGGFLGLFLLLLFTQSHLFNFFLESFLGRIILIILILLASYIHKVFGVVVVLGLSLDKLSKLKLLLLPTEEVLLLICSREPLPVL